MLRRLAILIRGLKFRFLQRHNLANVLINRCVYPMDLKPNGTRNIEKSKIEISQSEVRQCIDLLPDLNRLDSQGYPYTKVLEYLTSIKLLDLQSDDALLDAASGSEAEFGHLVGRFTQQSITCYCQDNFLPDFQMDGNSDIKFITGSIDKVPLPDGSLDAISCHHSFEHFSKDLDKKFITECLRLLKPGGRLVIVPFFLTNIYAEIVNNKLIAHFDENATYIYDSTASFPGWGPYEGFARTYDNHSFKERIIDIIPKDYAIKVVNVEYEGSPAPDMRKVSYQPTLNGNMKALFLVKNC